MRLLLVLLSLLLGTPAFAQSNTIVNFRNGTATVQASAANPLPVTPSAPSGTQDVEIVPGSAAKLGNAYVSTAALAASKVIKASAGNLYSFQVSADSTLSASAWWLMVFDATSLPGDGAVTPAKCFAYPAGTTSASYSFPTPVQLTTGITLGVSTNGCFTLANSAHAFISGDAQ